MTNPTPAYLVCSSIFEDDHGSLNDYFEAVHPLIEKSGAEVLIAGSLEQNIELVEGQWPNQKAKFTLFKFESMEKLREFWYSEEYQSIKHLRTNVIPPNFTFITEGFDESSYSLD
ncbi:DUF1330 domain-containing protein [Vibrio bathopelagicus]|uniref:DUF1330 domain-containing protein n=1 Tax=Vibrio bathopelagicus TaxID=2777577 RepID=UPI001864F154|nr:DUF1330 domain-containing protein [Vibrio bathopelagicus]MBY7729588.1 DUF1330 domain-containing protein [Vibrio splendidus]